MVKKYMTKITQIQKVMLLLITGRRKKEATSRNDVREACESRCQFEPILRTGAAPPFSFLYCNVVHISSHVSCRTLAGLAPTLPFEEEKTAAAAMHIVPDMFTYEPRALVCVCLMTIR